MTEEKIKEIIKEHAQGSLLFQAIMEVINNGVKEATLLAISNDQIPDVRSYNCGCASALSAIKYDLEELAELSEE